jgi:hypothetical protein
MNVSDVPSRRASTDFVRIGAVAGILVFILGFGLNFFLEPPNGPSYDATVADVEAVVAAYGGRLALGNSLRYVVYFLLLIFAVGLYDWVARRHGAVATGWGMVGVLAAAATGAIGTVANGALTIGLWRMPSLADEPQAFTVIWGLSSVLFNTVMWAWALMLIGFSLAGWYSEVMGRWLSVLGVFGGIAALLTAAGVGSVLNGGWMTGPWSVSLAVFPVWVLATSVRMLRRGRDAAETRKSSWLLTSMTS